MDTRRVRSWSGFARWLGETKTSAWLYRGVKSCDHKLIPRIGRPEARRSGYDRAIEIWLIDEFERLARTHLPVEAQPKSAWDWLAIAQHHGLPTRLLDWSHSPLVATYFAVEDQGARGDAAIYAFESKTVLDIKAQPDPMEVDLACEIRPPHVTSRIIAQSGTFTMHPDPTEVFEPEGLQKIIIDKGWCEFCKRQLHMLGIDRAALFPDLDGISNFLSWMYTGAKLTQSPFPQG